MNKLISFILVVCLAVLLPACESNGPKEKQSLEMAQNFLEAIKNDDYNAAFKLCDKEFFNTRTPDEWTEYFKGIKAKLGNLQTVKLKQKLADNRYSGRFYMYQFATKYDKGLAKEMITMIEKINSNDPILISGYKIESSKLDR